MNSNAIKYTLILGIIALAASIMLSYINEITKEPIKNAERQDFLIGLNSVLPTFNNMPDEDSIEINGNKIYIAKNDNRIVGFAVEAISKKGYSGDIKIIMGALPNGEIYGVAVVKHSETPGLGDKIEDKSFLNSFKDTVLTKIFKVKSDGGDIDQFSGATISPRALCEAVNTASAILLKAIQEQQNEY